MEDISLINSRIFNVKNDKSHEKYYADIIEAINNETEYDDTGKVPFLPLGKLNARKEREESLEVIDKVIQTGQFTSGPYIPEAERYLTAFYQANSCTATSSGTDALKIALKAAGMGWGDEVILPLNSFAATENAVMATGAVTVFANIDES